jgi:hypothetical protein
MNEVLDRFVAVCRADERVVAAFVTGSQATGTADAHSDLDLGVVTTDAAYAAFSAGGEAFVRLLGEPVFVERFSDGGPLFFVLADGTEGELAVGRESDFTRVAAGPHRVLLDKTGVLAGATFVGQRPDAAEQRELMRQQVVWFWHDLSHFITAMARGQHWWAYGQIEALRRFCINLARLQHDPFDADIGTECYWKIDKALPPEQLAALRETIGSMKPAAMLAAARAIVRVYQALAPPLARAHGIEYPAALERIVLDRLAALAPGPSEASVPRDLC